MTIVVQQYRYHLPQKAIKGDCPDCGPKHRKTLSRYVDSRTGELLPESYGRCDRESNCGYHHSPYHKPASGLSYADEVYQGEKMPPIPKEFFAAAGEWKRAGSTRKEVISRIQNSSTSADRDQAEAVARYLFDQPELKHSKPAEPVTKVYALPDEVYTPSLGHYERNQFAHLLSKQFGPRKARQLLDRFHIGTSAHWPGACVFWFIDELGQARGGQIKLFADDWHTDKYIDQAGTTHSKTSWVHYALQKRFERDKKPVPEWLTKYSQEADKCPCLFGLPQLVTAPADAPLAIVEAPKTAVICSHFFPEFIWLAVVGKSYLKPERLSAVRNRNIILYPDLNACYDTVGAKGHKLRGWLTLADELRAEGFRVEVSDFLEQHATNEQRQAGLDLADFLLEQPPSVSSIAEQLAQPGALLRVDRSDMELLPPSIDTDYPVEWDDPDPPNARPTIEPVTSFHTTPILL